MAFGTDEGDEATTFNGTIPQALMMMNGELVANATSAENGSFLHTVLTTEKSPHERHQANVFRSTGTQPKPQGDAGRRHVDPGEFLAAGRLSGLILGVAQQQRVYLYQVTG